MGPRDQEDEQSQGLSSESADTASVNEESFDNLRHCNIRKVLNVAEAKRQNSVLGMQFLRFCVFLCVYLFLVYNHRQAYVSESLYSGIKKRLAMTPFRDPETLAMKTWFDIVTVEDFWNWHEFVLVPQLLADSPTVPGPEERADALAKANTLLHHNKLVGSFRMTVIRAKERACAVPAKYAGAFARADADGGARSTCARELSGVSSGGWQDGHNTSAWTLYDPAGGSLQGLPRDLEASLAACRPPQPFISLLLPPFTPIVRLKPS